MFCHQWKPLRAACHKIGDEVCFCYLFSVQIWTSKKERKKEQRKKENKESREREIGRMTETCKARKKKERRN